jgi:ABC-type lipoprotein release transport system permease subunit
VNSLACVLRSGIDALVCHRGRSAVTVLALVAAVLPFLAGQGVSEGLRRQAEIAVREGADVCFTATALGRPAPVPLSVADRLRELEGVVAVRPRIVGEVTLGGEAVRAIVVGIDRLDDVSLRCVEGRWHEPGRPGELVVGRELAQRLGLSVGSRIPPFYRNDRGERVSTVVGLFAADTTLWQSYLIVTSFETAATIFADDGFATDLLIDCRPGYEQLVAESSLRKVRLPRVAGAPELQPRVLTRRQLQADVPSTLLRRGGLANLHYLLAFAVGVPLLAVVSGVGLAERRREVGVLKALGWQTDEVLLRSAAETCCLCAAAIVGAVAVAWFWLAALNGWCVAGVYLEGAGVVPQFRVPFRLGLAPIGLTFVVALAILLTATLTSNWRASVAPPMEALR